MPRGIKVEKHVLGTDGKYHRDPTYVGENAWDDSDDEGTNLNKVIDQDEGSTDSDSTEKRNWGADVKAARSAKEKDDRQELLAIYGRVVHCPMSCHLLFYQFRYSYTNCWG